MIKAVLFDCFGVLAKSSLEPFIDKYFPNDPDMAAHINDIDRQGCVGLLTYKQIVGEFAKLAKVSEVEVLKVLDENPPNTELLNYIETELKPSYKIGILSNASDNWLDDIFTSEQQALFDVAVLSCEVKCAKPDERIYRIVVEKLGLQPEECVFIDDVERYCTGASDIGMKAIVYKDLAQCRKELEKLLVLV